MTRAAASGLLPVDRPLVPAKHLDENGHCCGRKPMRYRREGYALCDRCEAAFGIDGVQIGNGSWRAVEGDFEETRVVRVPL